MRERLIRWTRSELGGLDPDKLVPAELIRFTTFDRVDGASRTLPAFYYRPAGYGKSSLLLDNGVRREDTVRDIGALLDWVAVQPELDADRVAVIGGSYGGYMSLAAMVEYDSRLRAGVDIVGISNFVTFLENTKP
jgi:dipeptidyl aminopeptidase/acylaminoacyl peptidase